METIPAEIKDLEDEQVEAIRLAENVQRQDLNPVEEARAIHRLMETYQLSARQVADTISKGPVYVEKRLALLELEKPHQLAVETGKLTLGHALLLLRLKNPEERKQFANKLLTWKPSVKDAQEHLEREYTLQLDQAPFDLAECMGCPSRSDNQKLLFESRIQKGSKGLCLNGTCFAGKLEAWKQEQEAVVREKGCPVFPDAYALEQEHPKAVRLDGPYAGFAKKTVKQCRSTCEKAVYAWGRYADVNELQLFCIDKKCRTETFALAHQPGTLPEGEREQRRASRRQNAARHFRQQFIVEEAVKRFARRPIVWKKLLAFHLILDTVKRLPVFQELGLVAELPEHRWALDPGILLDQKFTEAQLDQAIHEALRVVLENYEPTAAEHVARALNIQPAKEFVLSEAYLKTFVKQDLAALAKELGLVKHLKATGKLPAEPLTALKKPALIALFLESGFPLKGKVPKEIARLSKAR